MSIDYSGEEMENPFKEEVTGNEPDDLERLLADYEGGKIDRKTYLKLLALLITRDRLTDLLNRRGIEEVLSRAIRTHQREIFSSSTKPIAVLLIDGDGLKKINDTRGHNTGDIALQRIAKAITISASRPTDNAGRLGGDEFLVVMPETDLEGALIVADDIRRLVANNQDFPELSVSIGVALYSKIFTQTGLINQADNAMYRAKKSGGNAIAIHPYALPDDQTTLRLLSDFINMHHIKVITPSADTAATTSPPE